MQCPKPCTVCCPGKDINVINIKSVNTPRQFLLKKVLQSTSSIGEFSHPAQNLQQQPKKPHMSREFPLSSHRNLPWDAMPGSQMKLAQVLAQKRGTMLFPLPEWQNPESAGKSVLILYSPILCNLIRINGAHSQVNVDRIPAIQCQPQDYKQCL